GCRTCAAWDGSDVRDVEGRAHRGAAGAPVGEQPVAETVLHEHGRVDPEGDVPGEVRLGLHQPADHVVPHHLLVHRVGLDVLVVEVLGGRPRAGAAHRLREPPGTGRRGDLDRGEVTHQGAPEGAVQPEQGHEVHGDQQLGAGGVQVAAVRGVQAQVPHQVRVQPGV